MTNKIWNGPVSTSQFFGNKTKGYSYEPYGTTKLNMTTEEYKEIFGEPVKLPSAAEIAKEVETWSMNARFPYSSNSPPLPAEVVVTPEQNAQIAAMLKGPKLEQLNGKDAATKHDGGKTDWSLLPWDAVEEIIKVLQFGAGKYNEKGQGPHTWNWTKGSGLGKWRTLSAIFRHLTSYAKGETFDPESGLNHLAHAACGILFLIHYHKNPEQFGKME